MNTTEKKDHYAQDGFVKEISTNALFPGPPEYVKLPEASWLLYEFDP